MICVKTLSLTICVCTSKWIVEEISVLIYLSQNTSVCFLCNNTTHLMFTEEASKDRSGWSKHICAQIGQHGQCVLIPLDHGAHYTVSGSRQGLSTATFLGGTAFEYSFPRRWLHRKIISDALSAFSVFQKWVACVVQLIVLFVVSCSSNLFPCPGLLIWRLSTQFLISWYL